MARFPKDIKGLAHHFYHEFPSVIRKSTVTGSKNWSFCKCYISSWQQLRELMACAGEPVIIPTKYQDIDSGRSIAQFRNAVYELIP
jgi:hypothetical protein